MAWNFLFASLPAIFFAVLTGWKVAKKLFSTVGYYLAELAGFWLGLTVYTVGELTGWNGLEMGLELIWGFWGWLVTIGWWYRSYRLAMAGGIRWGFL
ncbi:MAG TPA: hypothetical protein PKV73_16670 [Agriterribacter sp.]|nr:hypothetical protein [Agriterribacter sp.]